MSMRLLFAVILACFSTPAISAVAGKWDVWATLTEHQFFCAEYYTCDPVYENSFEGLRINQRVFATLTVTDFLDGENKHQRYRLSFSTGSIGDSTDNYNRDLYAPLSWNGEVGSIGYSYDRFFGQSYERGTIRLSQYVAPVPLPASVALLPVGIAALTFFRKRRKRSYTGSIAPRDGNPAGASLKPVPGLKRP